MGSGDHGAAFRSGRQAIASFLTKRIDTFSPFTPKRWSVWAWEFQLQEWGFRRLGRRYWQCTGRYNLTGEAHLSLFAEEEWPARSASHSGGW